ncbi:MAG: DUF6976 family protein [Candidatus Hodarchaeota archaeon]
MLFTIDEIKTKITQGKNLLLAGEENVLEQLPTGNWIGGTIPYFMTDKGGLANQDMVYATELPDYIEGISIKVYDEKSISSVFLEAPENGFSLILIPSSCPTHFSFALNAPKYEGFGTRPLIGWITGIHLDDLGKKQAKIFNGKTGDVLDDSAIVMHVSLPKNMYTDIGIINIFSQGDGDTIVFPEDSFSATDAYINGEKRNFAEYIKENDLDSRFPLVANYYGVMINISIQSVDEENKKVVFYAPVFKGIEYKHAAEIKDYVKEFLLQMPQESVDKIVFSCNCILNYLYSELEGKKTGGILGPMTFGEIAYQLLNQTLAYITIDELPLEEEEEDEGE